jgi:8-oxo-dGTP pyrophosphatase MutT (NUDIX family)
LRPWKILSATPVLDNQYMKVDQETVELPSGRVYDDYYVLKRRGWVAILHETEDGILLNRQYKHGIREIVYELPSGGIDEGEAPETAAIREFEEETGLKPGDVSHFGSYAVSPTDSTSYAHLYVVQGTGPGTRMLDDREVIENIRVSRDELRSMIIDGRFHVITQIGMVLAYLNEMKQLGT